MNGQVFIVDLQGELAYLRIRALKTLKVKKIVHDCRMDCDALYHLHQIRLVNVHDTSCFHYIITGMPDVNLNDTLAYNGLAPNEGRDKSAYRSNPAYWATRPLTPQMMKWASNDVSKLLELEEKQTANLSFRDRHRAMQLSSEYTKAVSSRSVALVPCQVPMGRFIGPRGSNLRRLQRVTGTMIYQKWNDSSREKRWLVFYKTTAGLDKVKKALGN